MTIKYPSNHTTNPKVKVYKVREGAKVPKRYHPTDAGMDLFYCPSDPALKEAHFRPGQTMVLPTGLKISVPPGHMLQVMNKSGIASKKSLVTGACVVDSGYDGEIFVNLHNIGNNNQIIYEGDKLAQAVLIPVVTPGVEVVEEDNIYGGTTSRGDGGFGSTGDK